MIIEKNSVEFQYINISDLKQHKIGIPIFQRFYDWKPAQTAQLLLDIIDVCNDTSRELYLLDFIYYEADNKFMIADGQQRLVTLNILMKAINDHIDRESLTISKLELFDIVYDIVENNAKYDCNFNNYVCAPFKKIYTHFREWIDTNSGILEKIIEVLNNNIFVYVKKCKNADDAFVIFQQINTGGKPLTKDEIIQTAIKQYAKIYGIAITAKVKDIKQAVTSYYKYITADSSKNFDNIGIITFLRDKVTKYRGDFNKFVIPLNTLATLENNPISSVFCYIIRTSLYDVLNVLAMKGIDTTTNREYLEKVVLPLCMLSIVLSLTGGLPSLLKYLMNDVINLINIGKTADEISLTIATYINNNSNSCKMSYDDFTTSIGGTGNATPGIRKALLVMDAIISNTSGTINISKVNLEHIYPQTPKPIWATNGWPTNVDEQKEIINNIGNQFLLCESVNKAISINYISLKLPKYRTIITKDALLRTTINTVDFAKFETDRKNYVETRQREIAEEIYRTFPFGSVVLFK
ncbi:MAG: DUF262 domain-containing protein [Clostridia bacterium]|nr:DUF262 domain-containing protein [Clostridia bacterium]